jgi:Flp pilus assembly secretin CpaC
MRSCVVLCLFLSLNSTLAGRSKAQTPPNSNAVLKRLDQKLAERDRLQQEIDHLRRISGVVDQVMLRLQVVEVSLTKSRPLGFDSTRFVLPAKQAEGELQPEPNTAPCIYDRTVASDTLDTLKQLSLAWLMSDSSLVVVDGGTANCFEGGNCPYPKVTPEGKQSTEFVRFGMEYEASVKILGQEKTQLKLRARQSRLDPTLSNTVDSQKVPGLFERTAKIDCEIPLGKTIVVPGYTEKRMEKERVATVPYLGITKDRTRENLVQVFYLITPLKVSATETARGASAAAITK